MTRLLLSTVAAAALALGACGKADTPAADQNVIATPASTVSAISADDIARRIERLSSDEFLGRPPSGPGAQITMDYIADEMKAAGLKPMGANGTYFQPVTLTEMTVKDGSFAYIKSADKVIDYKAGENAVYWTKQYTQSVSVTDSPLVFVGYGVVAPEYDWNDYEGVDVEGKTVVMLVNDPGFEDKNDAQFKGETMTYYGRWTYKFEEAARQGAAGVIVIHEDAPASYPWEVVQGGWTGPQFDLVRPDKGMSRAELESWITRDQAAELFDIVDMDYDDMKAQAKTKGFKPVAMTGLSLSAKIDNDIKTTESANIAGGVVGSKYPDEYVLYMGHWDHMGRDESIEGDQIFNGAVDNATGTAAIIEIGEAFANQETPPERSILVVAVTAEESGLLGSAYYAADPIVPLNKTVAGINIDAILPIGETNDIIVVGYGASEIEDRLKALMDRDGKVIVPDQNPSAGYFYRSDHISLAKKGVPMLYADSGVDHVTKGSEFGREFGEIYTKERYHKAADEYSSDWDMSGIVYTTNLFYELGQNIADTEDWPNWYDGNEFRALRDDMLK
ncbi:M28 family metallopeptidase [Robiginitomaculum antarcticum]|uniref:M28 family metallopeptidase n=1 Tax=Robiginitomaculum antarcticum TaxID=437507 RepID=UPI0003799E1A|nr:M28 family metallopeptidase [Robiginitomaculum antarcticum]